MMEVVIIMNSMFLKTSDKIDKNKLIITDIKSRENSKGRPLREYTQNNNDYDTDQKRNINQSQRQIEEIKEIMNNCNNCKSKISQFVTKKPSHLHEKGVQTIQKPFLIDLIQERVQNICRQNNKLNRLIEQRQEELLQRQQELNEVQDKFTTILLSLSQQIAVSRRKRVEWHELVRTTHTDSDTPAYLKALNLQNQA